jgi:hypothetical protein
LVSFSLFSANNNFNWQPPAANFGCIQDTETSIFQHFPDKNRPAVNIIRKFSVSQFIELQHWGRVMFLFHGYNTEPSVFFEHPLAFLQYHRYFRSIKKLKCK